MNFVAVAIVSAIVLAWPPVQQKSHLLICLNCLLHCVNNSSQIAKKYKQVNLLNCLNKSQDKSPAPEVHLFSFVMINILTNMVNLLNNTISPFKNQHIQQ